MVGDNHLAAEVVDPLAGVPECVARAEAAHSEQGGLDLIELGLGLKPGLDEPRGPVASQPRSWDRTAEHQAREGGQPSVRRAFEGPSLDKEGAILQLSGQPRNDAFAETLGWVPHQEQAKGAEGHTTC